MLFLQHVQRLSFKFNKILAVEWAKYKIRSNAIAPGPFPKKVHGKGYCQDLKEKFDPSKKFL